MTNILVLSPVHDNALKEMARIGTVTYAPYASPEKLEGLAKDAEVIVLRSGVNLTAKVIRTSDKLKIIARAGVGVDNIDLDAALKRGITVFNVPAIAARSVAELTLGLMISLSRKIIVGNNTTKNGLWKKHELMGNCLKGKTIGIIGVGQIGSEVARICKALDMKVIASVRDARNDVVLLAERLGVQLRGFDELLRESDFVTIHVPLTTKTRTMISAEKLALMKPTAFLINTSREGVIDEKALYVAVKEKGIAGAALDVFDRQRTIFFGLDNIILTPHVGSATFEAQEDIGIALIANLRAALSGSHVDNQILDMPKK